MVIWHDTDDAPRTPTEIHSHDKVVLWIGSYPIEMGQKIIVDIKVLNKGKTERTETVEAEWRYNDYGKNNSYWTAIIGPFNAGDKIEYKITGIGPDGTPHVQIDEFVVTE
ncbi:MAG: hypothetical protein ACP5US_10695 [Candidatus Kryptoniota bacterium]